MYQIDVSVDPREPAPDTPKSWCVVGAALTVPDQIDGSVVNVSPDVDVWTVPLAAIRNALPARTEFAKIGDQIDTVQIVVPACLSWPRSMFAPPWAGRR